MNLGQGHDTPLDHGQQLCEILSKLNIPVVSYGPDKYHGYECTVTLTLTLKIWHWVKVMTHPWVMDNNCVKYYPAYPDPTNWIYGPDTDFPSVYLEPMSYLHGQDHTAYIAIIVA